MAKRELRAFAEGNSYKVEVEAGDFRWSIDEPVDEGGTNSGPSPVQELLGALIGCLTISYQFAARRKGIAIDRIEGWVASNEQRYIEQIAVELQVWSSAPQEQLEALLPIAERGCYVRNTLKPEIAYSIELVVNPD
jgi:uncharacterized OsmC-like protein